MFDVYRGVDGLGGKHQNDVLLVNINVDTLPP